MSRDGFSTREVLDLTVTPARQFQRRDEKRIIMSVRHGHRRIYFPEILIEIHSLRELRRPHTSLAALRRVLRILHQKDDVRLTELSSCQGDHPLLSDGKDIDLGTDGGQIVTLVRNTTQPTFSICLPEAARCRGSHADAGDSRALVAAALKLPAGNHAAPRKHFPAKEKSAKEK